MALGKTIQYTPFQETSFGYTNNEIATDQPQLSPTDIVKVRIGFQSGTHWDWTTGHISTPSVGTAVSTFNKQNTEWLVRGELADVDAVLAQLKFFPSDYEDTRNWTPTTWKDNQTSGVYANEEPPQIPDTQMGITVYDSNDGWLTGYAITWEATGYDYDNNRPYFSVEPSVQDVSSLGNPPLIDLGTIAHVPTSDNVTVSCEFRNYNSTSPYTGTAYGSFTTPSKIYVGDKKEGATDTISNRFNFTGSLAEAQAFLDNIGYERPSAEQTFDMMLRITDGAVGSEVTKTCWFSDATFEPTLPIPDLVGTEETTLVGLNVPQNWDIDHPAEVDLFWYTIQFDSVGTDGIESITENGGYNSAGTLDANGYFISNGKPTASTLKNHRLDAVEFNFRDDFNDNFSFTIQFHGSSTTLGTSYSSSVQTVNVTMANTEEFTNLYTSHNFEEDHRYYFANGAGLPNITHGYNVQYTARVTASDPNAIDIIWTYVPNANYQHGVDFFWENGDQLRMVGTRDDVNAMLNGLYFDPATDYDQNFSFSYKQTRLGGDTTSDAAEGDYYNIEIGVNNCISMTCAVSHDEYSFTPSTQDWSEDVSKTFDTGIRVTDLSDEHEWTTSYQTDYTVYMKMVDASGNDYNFGSLTSTSTGGAVGNAGGSNPKSYTGSKTAVNQAIANMKYVPYQDVTTGFFIQFKIVRDFDGAVLADYDQTRQITFNTATGHDETSYTQTNITSWSEDVSVLFGTGIQITDLSDENPDMGTYQTDYTVEIRASNSDTTQLNSGITIFTQDSSQLTSATGNGSWTAPYTMVGSKTAINDCLQNMKMIPDVDFEIPNGFYITYRVSRNYDSVNFYNHNISTNFSGQQTHPETTFTNPANFDWEEDVTKFYDSGLQITDLATENPDYSSYYQTTYTVKARAFYMSNYVEDGYVDADFVGVEGLPLNDIRISTGDTSQLTSFSGTGRGTDAFVMTGSKTAINDCLQNMKMIPDIDWTHSDWTDGSFFISYYVERNADNTVFNNYDISNTFNAGANHEDLALTNTTSFTWKPYDITTANTPPTAAGGAWDVFDKATENLDHPDYFGTQYLLKIGGKKWDGNQFISMTDDDGRIDTATVGDGLNGKGQLNDPFEYTGTKAQVQYVLDNLRFLPARYATGGLDPNTNKDSLYFYDVYLERLHDNVIHSNFDKTHVWYWNNDTLDTWWDGSFNIIGYYDTQGNIVPNQIEYAEDVINQPLFSGFDLVTDGTPDNDYGSYWHQSMPDIIYDIDVSLSANVGVLTIPNSNPLIEGQTITLTGTKYEINAQFRSMTFTPTVVDLIQNFDITATVNSVSGVSGTPSIDYGPYTVANMSVDVDANEVSVNTPSQHGINGLIFVNDSDETLNATGSNLVRSGNNFFTILDTSEVLPNVTSEYKLTFNNIPSGVTIWYYDTTNAVEVVNGVVDFCSKSQMNTISANGFSFKGIADTQADFSIDYTIERRVTETNGTVTFTTLVANQVLDCYKRTIPPLGVFVDYVASNSSWVYGEYKPLNDVDTVYGIMSPTNYDPNYLSGSLSGISGPNVADDSTTSGAAIMLCIRDEYIGAIHTPEAAYDDYSRLGVLATASGGIAVDYAPAYPRYEHYGGGTRYLGILPQKSYSGNGYNYTYTSGVTTNTEARVTTPWGTVKRYDLDLNLTYTHSTSNTITNFNPDILKQTNFNSSYSIGVSDRLVTPDGNYTSSLVGGFDRVINEGMNSYFYGFTATYSGGNVSIEADIKTVYNGTAIANPTHVLKSYTISNSNEINVQYVRYDSANDDIYCVILLETPTNTKHAIIAKLHYDSVSTTYSWSTVKDIQLLNANEYFALEAFLSDDFQTLITVESGRSGANLSPSYFNGVGRVRVYGKDQGGANNWGLVTSKSSSSLLTERNPYIGHDVNYCDFNGVDTVITGNKAVYQKDQGGTNNWGFVKVIEVALLTPSLYPLAAFVKFTKDHIVAVTRMKSGSNSYYTNYIMFIDPTDFTVDSSWASLEDDNSNQDEFYSYRLTPRIVESSREHNRIGIVLNDTGAYPPTYAKTYKVFDIPI